MARTITALGWLIRSRPGALVVRDVEGGYRRLEVKLGLHNGTPRLLLMLDTEPALVLTRLQGGRLRRLLRDALVDVVDQGDPHPGSEYGDQR